MRREDGDVGEPAPRTEQLRLPEGGRVRLLLVLLVVIAGLVWVLWPNRAAGPMAPSIAERARQAPAGDGGLSASVLSTEDLPPAGTRSLFDHLIAQNEQLPYPFEKLVALIRKQDPDNRPPLTLLIPQGRSLLKAQADFEHPRIVAAADFQGQNTATALGLSPRGQLFLGFVENAHEIEVISYNEAAGRFEFQLVQDYVEGGVPRIVYARRAICTTCHQAGAPIFPQRPWSETNGEPEIAAKIREVRRGDAAYQGVALAQPLAVPERFDELAEFGNFMIATQRAWLDGCGDGSAGAACRRQMLKVALRYLWRPAEFDAAGAEPQALRRLQAARWPAAGIPVADKSLRNRDPLEEGRGLRGYLRGLFTPRSTEPGARSNEDLEAFARLPKLRADLDPLTPRPPKRVLTAQDLDGAYGLAALFTVADFRQLEQAAAYDLARLDAAVARADAALFAPAPYSRVRAMKALLRALGGRADLDYCCLDTSEMSPPLALGVPPLVIRDGSVLKSFERYCFACHRGNPAKRLNFMAGASEDAVLANIKNKSEIRDALDWRRYRGTDKANKLMPPADSRQRHLLEEADAKGDKALEQMRNAVPALFDF